MYGVLYAYTPEAFPAPNRGTVSLLQAIIFILASTLSYKTTLRGSSPGPCLVTQLILIERRLLISKCGLGYGHCVLLKSYRRSLRSYRRHSRWQCQPEGTRIRFWRSTSGVFCGHVLVPN